MCKNVIHDVFWGGGCSVRTQEALWAALALRVTKILANHFLIWFLYFHLCLYLTFLLNKEKKLTNSN